MVYDIWCEDIVKHLVVAPADRANHLTIKYRAIYFCHCAASRKSREDVGEYAGERSESANRARLWHKILATTSFSLITEASA